MLVKTQKSNFCCCLTPLPGSGSLAIVITFYPFDFIILEIAWIDKLNECLLNNACCGNKKKISYKEEKILHKKHESYTFELPLITLSLLNKY